MVLTTGTTFFLALVCAAVLFAQQRVPAEYRYHRVYAVVPLIGTGQKGDNKRPLFAPAQASADHSGVIGWQMQLSDNGKLALVEFVGRTPADLQFIVKSNDPRLAAVFEKGKNTRQDIENEFRKYKKNFTLDSFGLRVQ